MIEIKDRIIELRLSKGMTQGELAKALDLSASSIGMYEQGRRKPSYKLLEKISDYFNVDMDYLMGKSNIKNKYQLENKINLVTNDEKVKTVARNEKIFAKFDKLSEKKKKLVENLINSYFDEDMEDEED